MPKQPDILEIYGDHTSTAWWRKVVSFQNKSASDARTAIKNLATHEESAAAHPQAFARHTGTYNPHEQYLMIEDSGLEPLQDEEGDAVVDEDGNPVMVLPEAGDGAPGADGKSAYQVAVDNGFTGTEAEWIASLKGEPGTPGQDGADGQDGAPGATGAKGDTGATGPKGDTGAAGAKGDTGATGPKGDAGAAGQDGANAPNVQIQYSVNGLTAWHDTFATGDLYQRNSTNGGVSWSAAMRFIGQDGAPGAKGDAGATGATGPKGDTGAAGAKGDTGATGAKGDTGATGATGPAGPNTVTAATTTDLTGLLYGNGSAISAKSIGTTAGTIAAGDHTHDTYLPKTGGTMTGNLYIKSDSSYASIGVVAQPGQFRYVIFSSLISGSASSRWGFWADNGAEAGANVGTDFNIGRYSDDGTYLGTPLFIKRSTGYVGIGYNTNPGCELDLSGSFKASGKATAKTLYASGDDGGVASQLGLSNVFNETLSSGTGTVKLAGATSRNSTGWLKIYNGTNVRYIPYWTTITG